MLGDCVQCGSQADVTRKAPPGHEGKWSYCLHCAEILKPDGTLAWPIRVWRFENAPKRFRDLSGHGGDEDWVAEVPSEYVDDWIPWMEDGSSFGRCDVSEHDHPSRSDWKIRIGAHA